MIPPTHPSDNQPPPLQPYDAFSTDLPLQQALVREGAGWALPAITEYGVLAGGEMMALGELANRNKPQFRPVDAYGRRVDEVDFHPAYHRLMALGVEHGITG